MNALAQTSDKMVKFIRLLTSNRDGEVVAAARALVRTLECAKLGIQDSADRIAKAEQPPSGFRNTNDTKAIDSPSWHAIACECEHSGPLRDEGKRQFVADMVVASTVRDGEPAGKQARWLCLIYVRVRR